MTISNAQQQVDEWIKTIGVRYFSELTNMAMLTEEVGEVARIIARRYGEQSAGASCAALIKMWLARRCSWPASRCRFCS